MFLKKRDTSIGSRERRARGQAHDYNPDDAHIRMAGAAVDWGDEKQRDLSGREEARS
jgi:hypothetical protein